MQLNFEQIKSITQGAATVENSGGMVTFHRFTPEEETLYLQTQFRDKVYSAAGVQLEFSTDGDCLCLSIETAPATSRTYFSVDIFVNGGVYKRIQNFDEKALPTDYTQGVFPLGRFSEEIPLPSGEKTVRIVFPWSVKTQLCRMELKNATHITPCKKQKTLIMYGDSITNGYDAVFTSNSYAVRLADAMGAELFNKGIGGEIFCPSLAAIQCHPTPDYITVAYGTNDWGTAEQEDFKKRCKAFYANIAGNYPDAQIYAITPIWRRNYQEQRIFGDFFDVERTIRQVCKDYANIKVITGWELVPHAESNFADQRVHPNDKGFGYYFENLKKVLEI